MNRTNDIWLVLAMLCSLSLFVGTRLWDAWQNSLARKQHQRSWEQSASGFAQELRTNVTLSRQMQQVFAKIDRRLRSLAMKKESVALERQRALSHLEPHQFNPERMTLYVFSFAKPFARVVRKKGLASRRGGFLARLFHQLSLWKNLQDNEKERLDTRVEHIFGPFINADLLLRHQGGRCVDVTFEGKRRVLAWDFIRSRGAPTGAYLMPVEPLKVLFIHFCRMRHPRSKHWLLLWRRRLSISTAKAWPSCSRLKRFEKSFPRWCRSIPDRIQLCCRRLGR